MKASATPSIAVEDTSMEDKKDNAAVEENANVRDRETENANAIEEEIKMEVDIQNQKMNCVRMLIIKRLLYY